MQSPEVGAIRLPAIILVEPQLPENIGAAARAMANFGLRELRLVAPQAKWPSAKARAVSSGAHAIIDGATVHETTAIAVADLQFVLATTARMRGIPKPVFGPREAAADLARRSASGQAGGILFGRERWGLTNEDVALSDAIVTFPVNPAFASLNIAQAVLLMSYEWLASGQGDEPSLRGEIPDIDLAPAPKAELSGLVDHLVSALEPTGYFRSPSKRPTMVHNLRAVLQRAGLAEGEIRVLRGVIAALEGRHEGRRRMPAAAPVAPAGDA